MVDGCDLEQGSFPGAGCSGAELYEVAWRDLAGVGRGLVTGAVEELLEEQDFFWCEHLDSSEGFEVGYSLGELLVEFAGVGCRGVGDRGRGASFGDPELASSSGGLSG